MCPLQQQQGSHGRCIHASPPSAVALVVARSPHTLLRHGLPTPCCGTVFGLKGSFCQPRPQAWETRQIAVSTLQGSFKISVWVGRTPLPGPRADDGPPLPGLRPGLTETAFQAEVAAVLGAEPIGILAHASGWGALTPRVRGGSNRPGPRRES